MRFALKGIIAAARRLGSGPTPTYPLDAFTSGMWAAWGIKRLLNSWSDPLIRVRRSSDNAEQDIGFDVAGDLDTTALASFVASASGFVVTVYDQTGGGNHLTGGTSSVQPKIVDAGTYLGLLSLNGTSNYLKTVTSTPTTNAIVLLGRMKLRNYSPGPGDYRVISMNNVNAAGHSASGVVQQANTVPYTNTYTFTGTTINMRAIHGSALTTEGASLWNFNRTNSGYAVTTLYKNGAEVPFVFPGTEIYTAPSGPFTSEPISIGYDNVVDGQYAPLDWKFGAVWITDQSATAAAITAATQPVAVTAYRYMKIEVTAPVDINSTTSIAEMEVAETTGGSNFITSAMPSTGSSDAFTGNVFSRATDGNPSTSAVSHDIVSTGGYHLVGTVDFGVAKVIKELRLFSQPGESGRAPKDFILSGSNDGSSYTTLLTSTGNTGWSAGTAKVFAIP